jgi:hypothetical protein
VLEGKASVPLRLAANFEVVLKKQLQFGDRGKLPFTWNTYTPNLFNNGHEGLLRLAEGESGPRLKA